MSDMASSTALKVTKAADLPSAIYKHLFEHIRVLYNRRLISSSILTDNRGRAHRGVRVGSFVYVQQDKQQNSCYGKIARQGQNIVWVIHAPSKKVVGKVVNGKTVRIKG